MTLQKGGFQVLCRTESTTMLAIMAVRYYASRSHQPDVVPDRRGRLAHTNAVRSESDDVS
jgi:hypothetical protein